MKNRAMVVFLMVFISMLFFSQVIAMESVKKSNGQLIYVPVSYTSSNYTRNDATVYQSITSKVTTRNLDFNNPILVTSVDYYKGDGTFICTLIPEGPFTLQPGATTSYVVNPSTIPYSLPSISEKSIPYVLIKWESIRHHKVNAPIAGMFMAVSRPDGTGAEILSLDNLQGTVLDEF